MIPDPTGVNVEAPARRGVQGYVMAGGSSSRFGFDKAQARLGGQTMLARTCDLVVAVTGQMTVVAPAGRYEKLGLRTISEARPGEGPLGGVIAALMDAQAREHRQCWCLIVGCDMPFLTRDWLLFLCERAVGSDAEVILPCSANGPEPLCACWSTQGISTLEAAFADGVRKVTQAMKRLRMEILGENDWKRFDSAGRLFWNMNTQDDYDRAKGILEMERG